MRRDRCTICENELLDDDHKTSEWAGGYAHDECIHEGNPRGETGMKLFDALRNRGYEVKVRHRRRYRSPDGRTYVMTKQEYIESAGIPHMKDVRLVGEGGDTTVWLRDPHGRGASAGALPAPRITTQRSAQGHVDPAPQNRRRRQPLPVRRRRMLTRDELFELAQRHADDVWPEDSGEIGLGHLVLKRHGIHAEDAALLAMFVVTSAPTAAGEASLFFSGLIFGLWLGDEEAKARGR
jgi:hypothetical protein